MRLANSAIGLLLCMTSCAATPPPVARTPPPSSYKLQVPPEMAGPFPTAYRATVATWARGNFLDPYSLRDVFVTKPVEAEARSGQYGWLVCLGVNARNRFGAYTGQQWYALLLRDAYVVDAYPKPTSSSQPIGMPAYDRAMSRASDYQNQANAIGGALMLNLCGDAIKSGRTVLERFPELEQRR